MIKLILFAVYYHCLCIFFSYSQLTHLPISSFSPPSLVMPAILNVQVPPSCFCLACFAQLYPLPSPTPYLYPYPLHLFPPCHPPEAPRERWIQASVFLSISRFAYPVSLTLLVLTIQFPPLLGQFIASHLSTHHQVGTHHTLSYKLSSSCFWAFMPWLGTLPHLSLPPAGCCSLFC